MSITDRSKITVTISPPSIRLTIEVLNPLPLKTIPKLCFQSGQGVINYDVNTLVILHNVRQKGWNGFTNKRSLHTNNCHQTKNRQDDTTTAGRKGGGLFLIDKIFS